jgi:hypothetical protein
MRDPWLDLYVEDILNRQVYRNGIRIFKWRWWKK